MPQISRARHLPNLLQTLISPSGKYSTFKEAQVFDIYIYGILYVTRRLTLATNKLPWTKLVSLIYLIWQNISISESTFRPAV
jgi:hypothetical protein